MTTNQPLSVYRDGAADGAAAERVVRRVVTKLSKVDQLSPNPLPPAFHRHVREVIVIVSSSRGGSSVVAELIRRRLAGALQPQGESVPFMTLAGLRSPYVTSGSDAIEGPVSESSLDLLRRALGVEVAPRVTRLNDVLVKRFAVDLTRRLTVQWPDVDVTLDEVEVAVDETFRELRDEHGWGLYEFRDRQEFHARFLSRIRANHAGINPMYYDWTPSGLAKYWPGVPIPVGPPSDCLLEMPPFLLISPTSTPTLAAFEQFPLIMKTTSDAYRLSIAERMFPDTTIRYLHLTRNPGACINGLYDGWLHRGFFSVQVADGDLDISGYSDRFPEWGKRWWKFDLPPGWAAVKDRPLAQVCAFQWASAHRAILAHLESGSVDSHRVKFEDLFPALAGGPLPSGLGAWLRNGSDHTVELPGAPIEPIMATEFPDAERWRKRITTIGPLLNERAAVDLAWLLGYEL